MHKSLSLLSVVAVSVCAPQLQAQQAQNAGFGATNRIFDIDALSGQLGSLGCAELNGKFYVSARWAFGMGTTNSTHPIIVIDPSTTPAGVSTFDQPSAALPSTWGIRDMATDGVSLIGGENSGLHVFDPNSPPGSPAVLVNQVVTSTGTTAITQPITGPGFALLSIYRALAYDPAGNGGAGSFWTASFGSDILECDMAGNILQQFPQPAAAPQWSAYGLALDPTTGNLWCDAIPNAGQIAEIDVTTMLPTGRGFAHSDPGFITQGGLSTVGFASGGIIDPTVSWPSVFTVCNLGQGTSDALSTRRIHLLPGLQGNDEVELRIGVNGTGTQTGEVLASLGDTADIELVEPPWSGFGTQPPPRNGLPGCLVANVGPAAVSDSLTNVGFIPIFGPFGITDLPEFRRQSGISQPFQDPSYVLVNMTVGVPLTTTIPANLPLGQGDQIALQVFHIGLQAPWIIKATNECWYSIVPTLSGIVVSAEGTNSFNSNTTSGFFKIENHPGADHGDIQTLQFDWLADPTGTQGTMVFDTDQVGMADVFMGGIGAVAGCVNTYRNASDVTSGLVYPGTDPATCAGNLGADTGVIRTNLSGNNTKTLDFSFAPGFGPGKLLEFDCDTDGGAGITGAAMAGMVVNLTTSVSGPLSGVLAIDPAISNRSQVVFP